MTFSPETLHKTKQRDVLKFLKSLLQFRETTDRASQHCTQWQMLRSSRRSRREVKVRNGRLLSNESVTVAEPNDLAIATLNFLLYLD